MKRSRFDVRLDRRKFAHLWEVGRNGAHLNRSWDSWSWWNQHVANWPSHHFQIGSHPNRLYQCVSISLAEGWHLNVAVHGFNLPFVASLGNQVVNVRHDLRVLLDLLVCRFIGERVRFRFMQVQATLH